MRTKFKPRILTIDDDPSVTAMVQRLFEEDGCYTVLIENKSSRALEAAQRFSPDLILLDMNMPGKSGREVAEQIRNEPRLRYCPIIFFTSLIAAGQAGESIAGDDVAATLPDDEGVASGVGVGVTQCLPKGIALQKLFDNVEGILKNRQYSGQPPAEAGAQPDETVRAEEDPDAPGRPALAEGNCPGHQLRAAPARRKSRTNPKTASIPVIGSGIGL